MKIGIFTDTYFPQVSGVSTSIKLLKDQLTKRGHEVVIFTTTDPQSVPEPNVVRLPSVPFVSFEDRRIAYAGFDKCLKIARNEKLDLVHTHTEFSLGMAGRYVASRMKIPTVHTYHTMYEKYTHYIMNGHLIQPKHVRRISRMYCNNADRIIAPSQLTADALMSYGVNIPISVVSTGVELPDITMKSYSSVRSRMRSELGLSEDDWLLLSLSRLSKEKQIDQVIEAFPEILKQIPQAYLVIVGDGPHREALESLAQKLQISRIKFIGEIPYDRVTDYYQMADVYVNASESETQGLTYLEAIVNYLPVIAKENDFLSSIMVKASYGRLYRGKENIVKAVVEFSNKKQTNEIPDIDRDGLYSISVERFGREAEKVYEDTLKESLAYHRPNKTFERFQNGLAQFVREVMIGHDNLTDDE